MDIDHPIYDEESFTINNAEKYAKDLGFPSLEDMLAEFGVDATYSICTCAKYQGLYEASKYMRDFPVLRLLNKTVTACDPATDPALEEVEVVSLDEHGTMVKHKRPNETRIEPQGEI